jgi:hypothetical protein
MAEVPLADAIVKLRAELERAVKEGDKQALRFTVENIELQLRGPRAATFAHQHELAQVRHVRPGKVVARGPLTVGLTDTVGAEAKASVWTVLTLGAKGEHSREATQHLTLTLKPHLAGRPASEGIDVADAIQGPPRSEP